MAILPSVAFAEGCAKALPQDKGVEAPCSGVLVPAEMAGSCIKLKRVEIPRIQADLQECRSLLAIEKKGREREVRVWRDECRRPLPAPESSGDLLPYLVVSGVAVLVGAVVGVVAWEKWVR